MVKIKKDKLDSLIDDKVILGDDIKKLISRFNKKHGRFIDSIEVVNDYGHYGEVFVHILIKI